MFKKLYYSTIILLLQAFSALSMEQNRIISAGTEEQEILVAPRVSLWFTNPSRACTTEIEHLKKSHEPIAQKIIEEMAHNPKKAIVLHSIPYELVETFCAAHLSERSSRNPKRHKEIRITYCPAMAIFDKQKIVGQYQQIIGGENCLYHNFLEPIETIKDELGWHLKEQVKTAEEVYNLSARHAPEEFTTRAVLKHRDDRYELKETTSAFLISDKILDARYIIFKKSEITFGN